MKRILGIDIMCAAMVADGSSGGGGAPNPSTAEEYFNRGIAYHNKRDYDWAIADFTDAIRLNPNYAWAYGHRGIAYKNRGDYDRAIADYNEVLRLDPNDAVAYYNRGRAYALKGDNDRAIADYNEVLRLDPNNARAYSNRGIAYANKGNYDRAIADYNEALRLDPNDADAYGNRGYAYANKGDYDRAIADFTQALRLNPNDALAYSNRGDAYLDKKDNDRAIADYSEALRLNPNDAAAYSNRGLAYFRKGHNDRAIADYNEALRLNPNYALTYSNRGLAYYNKKDYVRARADWEKALQIDPNYATARNNLEVLRGLEAAASCKVCQKKENLYGDPIVGYNVEMHQTHSETVGDTTTHYHSIDKCEPVRFRICRDCLSKKVRKDMTGFALLMLLSVVFLVAGMVSPPLIGSQLSLMVLGIGGVALCFSLTLFAMRILAGSKKRDAFYLWELASPIRSPGFIEEIKKTKKIEYSNKRELMGFGGRTATWALGCGIALVIFFAALNFSMPVPAVSKVKPIGDSPNTATLYVQSNLTLTSFDGQKVNRKAMSGSKTGAVNVPAGEHALVFDYMSETSDGNKTTTTTAKGFEFESTFESGQYYFVNFQLTGDKKIRVYLRQTEEGVYLDPEKGK